MMSEPENELEFNENVKEIRTKLKFRELKALRELEQYLERLVQIYIPDKNEYYIGILRKIEDREATGRMDIKVTLKSYLKRSGIPYTLEFYDKRIDKQPKVELFRLFSKKAQYTVMDEMKRY